MRQVLAKYPSLDIYAKPGTKVRAIYMNGEPTNGYADDKWTVVEHLSEDGIYTIERTEVHESSTDVYLFEFPGIRFNSVCLSPVQDGFTSGFIAELSKHLSK